MALKTDYTFHIGEQHLKQGKPCQDYALSGVLESGQAYAIVSDGCSSGGMTDIGARLLVLATQRAVREHIKSGSDLHQWHIPLVRDIHAENYRTNLELHPRDMLATNLFAIKSGNRIWVHVAGDGVVALQYENGLYVHRYAWKDNRPYYPAYRLGGFHNSFIESHDTSRHPLELRVEYSTAEEHPIESMHFTIGEGMAGINHFYEDVAGYNSGNRLIAVGLFSDGVEQVDGMNTFEVVSALMAFKSTGGQFAVRRMNRFLREAKKLGRGPIDDIAMAVIHLGESAAENGGKHDTHQESDEGHT